MTQPNPEMVQEQKKRIREQAHANRNAQPNKDELSQAICAKFMALPDYARAATVMYYIDVRSEVRTRQDLPAALMQKKRIVVPWCNGRGELELFHLESMEELAVGMYKILEPKQELRAIAAKHDHEIERLRRHLCTRHDLLPIGILRCFQIDDDSVAVLSKPGEEPRNNLCDQRASRPRNYGGGLLERCMRIGHGMLKERLYRISRF